MEPAIKEGNDHIFATFAQGLIVVYAMERSNPMLWSKRLDEDVTSITWCPFYKAIAICSSSTVQIFQAEDGLILNTIQRSICNDLLWKRLNGPFKSMLILNCHDGLFFFADGMHPVFNIPSPFDLLDVNISDDLSQIQCIHRDNSVSNYSTNWDFSLMKSFTRISDQIVESSTICTSWNNLVAALAKYITGLNWLRTKLSQTDADVNNAVLGLSLLTADDNIYLQRLKDSVTIRDAYRFRDQLVRCFEDVKSRAEQVNDSCLTIPEESNSCLLAWFLARKTNMACLFFNFFKSFFR